MSDWGIFVNGSAAAPAPVSVPFAPAKATQIDFAGEPPRNLANFSILSLGAVNVQLVSGDGALNAMFDPAIVPGAGLGVRKPGDAKGDDSIGAGETIQIAFYNAALTAYRPLTVERLSFRSAVADGLVRIVTDHGSATDRMSAFFARAARGDAFFADTRFVLFAFVDTPFHVAAIGVADAPSAAALPLLANASNLGFAARRKSRV